MQTAAPTYSEADLERILVSKDAIQARVQQLGAEISRVYQGCDVTVISVLSGAMLFTADLVRRFEFPTRLDCVRAESYANATSAQNPPRITNPLKTDIERRHVLVVDDILDSGNTLRAIFDYLRQANPASLRSCVLLDKPARHDASLRADFVGFTIPDAFVVGYGLDFAERYRNLSSIGILRPELQCATRHP